MRLLVPVLAAVFAAGGLTAAPVPLPAKFDPPSVTGQAASIERLTELAAGFVDSVQPGGGESMKKSIADTLGADGWKGIDAKKPVGVYAYLRPKLETSAVVFMLPITDEKDALATLAKLGFVAEADDTRKGLYAVGHKGIFGQDKKAQMRFHDGHACLALNADPDEFAADKLPPAKAIVDADEKAPILAKLHLAHTPKELKELVSGWWASGTAAAQQLETNPPQSMPKSWPGLAKAAMAWTTANSDALFGDGEAVTLRVKAEPKSAALDFEITVTPKDKTALAKSVAAIKPTPGRFHQLVTKDAVGGLWLTVGPGLNKEVRAKAGAFAGDLLGMIPANEMGKPVLTELSRAVEAMLADGKTDLGLALLGPDKAGAHTAVLGLAVTDPSGIEKAVRKVVADLPKEVQPLVKLDAEKAGELSVHTFTLPAEAKAESIFGKEATVRLAFGKDAVYLSVGPDGLAEIKRAAGLKPTDGKRFDVVVNPKKLSAMMEAATGQPADGAGMWMTMVFGKGDGLRSLFGIDVKGGKELVINYTQNGAGLVGAVTFVGRSAGPVPPPVVKPALPPVEK